MQTQPSAQGIAALYMGNPGALQQRVQKEQQAKPGLPPDLKQLMALNIVTNEQDAAKRQQAINALNSMAPAGQEPPTVAQSIRQQAEQAMQARMLQEQRQQMALRDLIQQGGMTGGIPENVPQPEAQPEAQGIDELPVNMEFAGGGIVAFAGGDNVRGYETPYDRMTRENRERAERERLERLRRIEEEGGATSSYGEQMRNLGQMIDRFVPDPVQLFRRLVSDPSLAREAAAQEAAARPTPAVDNRAALNRADAGIRAALPEVQRAPLPGPTLRAAPPAAPAQAPAAPAAPVAQSLKDIVAERAGLADTERERAMERYGKMLPRPDMSQYDRLIAELEGRKKQLEAPKAGFDAFAELMGQIAAAGPQRTWYEAGAKGAAGQQALNRERQMQQFELTKQGIEIAQRKIDADRAYNKELYSVGEDATKRIDQIAKDTATELGLDRRNAATLANQLKVANIGAQAQITAAGMRGEGRTTLTPKDRAEIANKASDNVQNRIKTDMGLQLQIRKNPALMNMLVQQETERLLAAAEGRTIAPAPGAGSPGGNTRLRFDAQGNPIQ